MKNGRKLFALLLALVLAASMLSVGAVAVQEDAPAQEVTVQEELEEIFYDVAWIKWGYDCDFFAEGEAADDELVYHYTFYDAIAIAEVLEEVEYGTRYQLAYSDYMELLDSKFVNHGDMKDYLNNVDEFTCYDAQTDTVVLFDCNSGFGDAVGFPVTSICQDDNTYYLQGLYVYYDEPDSYFENLEEGFDWYLYDRYEEPYKAEIYGARTMTLVYEDGSFKIAAFEASTCYAKDGVMYDLENREASYAVQSQNYICDTAADEATPAADNGVTLTFGEELASCFCGKELWVPDGQTVTFTAEVDEAWELQDVQVAGTSLVAADGVYSITVEEPVVIDVYAAEKPPVVTTIESENGASLSTTGDSDYYGSLTLIMDEMNDAAGENAANLVIEKLGDQSKAVAFDIHLEADGTVCQVLEGDTVQVTLPIPAGWDAKDTVVYYVAEDGTLTDMEGVVNEDDHTITFTTTHFSTYVLAVVEGGSDEVSPETGDLSVEAAAVALMAATAGMALTIGKKKEV